MGLEELSRASRTVAITGYQGFIGRHLFDYFLRTPCAMTGYDRKNGPDGDVNVAKLVDADWCFHLAAETDAQSADNEAMWRNNVLATEKVVAKYGSKTIFASTCAVNYPGTPYADSKDLAERMVFRNGGRVVRLCNIFGPGGHGVIDNFARAPVLRIRGDGSQLRTYAHVNRAVDAFIRMMEEPEGTLHILPGADMTVREIAEAFYPFTATETVPRLGTDIQTGVQVYPSFTSS